MIHEKTLTRAHNLVDHRYAKKGGWGEDVNAIKS
jgi:hypothetical protein